MAIEHINYIDVRVRQPAAGIEGKYNGIPLETPRILSFDEVLKLDGSKYFWIEYRGEELRYDKIKCVKNVLYLEYDMSEVHGLKSGYGRIYWIWDRLPFEEQIKEHRDGRTN